MITYPFILELPTECTFTNDVDWYYIDPNGKTWMWHGAQMLLEWLTIDGWKSRG